MQLPRPSANMEEYNRVMERGFKRFPERKANYEKFLEYQFDESTVLVPHMPVKMDYEVGNKCNFRCKMCLMSEISNQRPPDMKFDDFKTSLDEQIGLIEIKLQGLGEPLLNPDFFKMVDLAVERDIWVRTTTNASLLHLNDNYKQMIDSKVGEIQVSIDGATKETFEKIRLGSDFHQVVENVKMMNDYAARMGQVWRSSCWMLVQNDNYHEVEQLLDVAEYMGFSRVVYSIAIGSWGKENWEEINKDKEIKQEFSDDLAKHLMEKGKNKGIDVTFWDGKDKYKICDDKNNRCAWLYSRAFISAGMRIVPCCVICDANTSDLGNALNFKENWNSEAYLNLRLAHLNGNIPRMCRNCYEHMHDK